ncbi:bile acid:sodium symporter family protein [uncultured Dysosmobacter sp.]|uniref:bile acid:sodium symporter family protein n=1 Tax=uncultured Dysosmobacter sp. TaxID=2591384 RepID=UPI0026731843|nr:bile acid:sodium symporter [uncultured Dysosmobacter sp.]
MGVFSPYVGYMMIFQTFANSLGGGFRDLAQVMAHPKPVLLTMLTLHVLMPVIALGAGVLIFPQNPLYTLSLVLVESSPAAVSSLIWMTIGGGSTGICLSTVLLDSLLSPLILPLTLRLLCGTMVALDTLGLIKSLMVMVVIPAAAAMFLCRVWGRERCSHLKTQLALPSKLVLLLIVSANVTRCADSLRHLNISLALLVCCSLVMRVLGLTIGFGISRLFRLPYDTGLAVSVNSGMRNNSAAATLAAQYFPSDVVFSPSVSPVLSQLSVSLAVRLLQRVYPSGETTPK